MSNKPAKSDQNPRASEEPAGAGRSEKSPNRGLAEKSVTEHHFPGADGPSGAEAEEDNNP
jgi:hypothetical protein